MLARDEDAVREVAGRILQPLKDALGDAAEVRIEPCLSQIGSGSLPVDRLRSWSLVCRAAGPKRGGEARLNQLVDSFRALPIPVVGRLRDGALVFDLRCLEDESGFLAQLQKLARPSR
jgi:L-seryl-tRNA(Ser) seleniumtransferase